MVSTLSFCVNGPNERKEFGCRSSERFRLGESTDCQLVPIYTLRSTLVLTGRLKSSLTTVSINI